MRTLLISMTLAGTFAAAGAAQSTSSPVPSPTGAPIPPAVTSAPPKIVAFGDSLTSGHRLPRNDAYPAVLERQLREAGLPYTVINHGVSGDTTGGGVRRLERVLAEQPQILILAFGANDGLRGVPVAQVRSNLERIIERAHDQDIKVLLVGMEALPLYGWQYTVDFHNVFPDLAKKYDVPLVPFMLDGVLGNPDLMSPDGIHPNAAGAQTIAGNIWRALRPLAQSLLAAAD
jgi:acyl-CoA thioesterase-1